MLSQPRDPAEALQSLRSWVKQAEIDGGLRPGLTTDERQRLTELERENRELRRANEILKSATAFSRGSSPATATFVKCVEAHKGDLRGRADLPNVGDRPVHLLLFIAKLHAARVRREGALRGVEASRLG